MRKLREVLRLTHALGMSGRLAEVTTGAGKIVQRRALAKKRRQ